MSLSLERVTARYGRRTAVGGISIGLGTGGLVGLVGPNGSGKSSLLKAIAGVLRHEGLIDWRGKPLSALKPLERARTVAYLPQTPAAHWPMRAADLVALGRMPHAPSASRVRADDAAAVERALEACEASSLADRSVDELSGGERARVLLARALAVGAPVLLVDEPVQALDPYHQLKIIDMLRRYARADALVIAVLHDLALAARFCTSIVLLYEGSIAAHGLPGEVLTASTLERHYTITPYLAQHAGEPVVVPWRALGR